MMMATIVRQKFVTREEVRRRRNEAVFVFGDVQIEVTKYLTVKWRQVMPAGPVTGKPLV